MVVMSLAFLAVFLANSVLLFVFSELAAIGSQQPDPAGRKETAARITQQQSLSTIEALLHAFSGSHMIVTPLNQLVNAAIWY